MDAVSFDDVMLNSTLTRVKSMFYCDEMTRKHGRLYKAISVLDFNGFNLTRGNDSRFSKIIGDSSKLAEKLFPQLLGRTIFINTPSYFYWTFALIKPLMSARAVEKMVFCPAKGDIAACPYLSRNLDLDKVPTFLGGSCNCVGGCIGGVPNSQTSPINQIDGDGMSSMTVSARSSETIDFVVAQGLKLSYSLKVDNRKIEIKGIFTSSNGAVSSFIKKRFLESDEGTLNGNFTATEDGVCVLEFDNSASILRSKVIHYKISVE